MSVFHFQKPLSLELSCDTHMRIVVPSGGLDETIGWAGFGQARAGVACKADRWSSQNNSELPTSFDMKVMPSAETFPPTISNLGPEADNDAYPFATGSNGTLISYVGSGTTQYKVSYKASGSVGYTAVMYTNSDMSTWYLIDGTSVSTTGLFAVSAGDRLRFETVTTGVGENPTVSPQDTSF